MQRFLLLPLLLSSLGGCASEPMPTSKGGSPVRSVSSITMVHATVPSWDVDIDFPRGPITASAVMAYQIYSQYFIGQRSGRPFTALASVNTSSRDLSSRALVRHHTAWQTPRGVDNVVTQSFGVDSMCPNGTQFRTELVERDGRQLPVWARFGCRHSMFNLSTAQVFDQLSGHLLLYFSYDKDFEPNEVRNLRVLTELRAGQPSPVLELGSVDDLIREVLRRAL